YGSGPSGTMANGPHGEVWFSSDVGILYRARDAWHRVGRGEGLPFLGTRTVFVDREGSTWAGSVGLFLWRGRGLIERYEPDDNFPGDTAWRFQRDPAGVLWAGTNRCLARVADGKWACVAGADHREVRAMAFPAQGGVFFGGFPSELGYLDPDGALTTLGHDGASTDRGILSLAIGPHDDLWVATRSGLFRLAGARLPGMLERVVVPGVPADAWYASLLVADGRLWAASSHGLIVRDADRWRVYGEADGLRSASVRYLAHTLSRGICVSYTAALGLSCFAREGSRLTGLSHYDLERGLGTGAVYFLGEDHRHHLWVGTGDGVDVFTPGGVEHFGQRDGLAGDDAAANAFFEDTDGTVWLGATGGASRVHAERYDGPPPPPRAVIVSGELGGQPIATGDAAANETPHDQNALQIELGSDRLTNTERIEHQVRLLPLEPQWSTTLSRQARYPALLPGAYHLEARARIASGPWGPVASLAFAIRPAWWQTRWFLIASAAAVVLSIVVGFTLRQRAALRRRTQQHRAESAANLRALLELVPDLISVHGGGKVIYANLAARRMFGFGDGDAGELGGRIHADDRARVADVLRPPTYAGPHWLSPVIELRVGDDDGGWRTCEVSGVQTALEGATVVVVSGRDVTERHRLRAQLVMSDRMASLGTLAAGIAHEINNPLAYVLGNLQLMREALAPVDPDAPPRDRIEEISSAITDATDGAQRVRKIVQGLRSFSRADDERRGSLDVADVLRAAIRLTANEVRHRAELICELGAAPRVVADDGRLTQVFINLIVNAAHAIPEGAWHHHRITVRTRTDEHGYAAIEVEDTGQGMAPETLARAFDPFFTTKDVGSGTGLGLSICHGIVGGLGGQIAIDSTVGRGTRILVLLPPAPGTEIAIPRSVTTPVPLGPHRLRVLVVDDEPLVSDMLARVLRKDHEVVAVSNGRDALDQISCGQRFDAIVSDVMMPNMTGIELLDALVAIDEEQARRLIFLSGGVFSPQARAQLDALGTLQLEKPISPKELRKAVMSVARGEARPAA
ncbi:MAG TPA: ATP-binding protein, partial [Kofleriaceae bacterium]